MHEYKCSSCKSGFLLEAGDVLICSYCSRLFFKNDLKAEMHCKKCGKHFFIKNDDDTFTCKKCNEIFEAYDNLENKDDKASDSSMASIKDGKIYDEVKDDIESTNINISNDSNFTNDSNGSKTEKQINDSNQADKGSFAQIYSPDVSKQESNTKNDCAKENPIIESNNKKDLKPDKFFFAQKKEENLDNWKKENLHNTDLDFYRYIGKMFFFFYPNAIFNELKQFSEGGNANQPNFKGFINGYLSCASHSETAQQIIDFFNGKDSVSMSENYKINVLFLFFMNMMRVVIDEENNRSMIIENKNMFYHILFDQGGICQRKAFDLVASNEYQAELIYFINDICNGKSSSYDFETLKGYIVDNEKRKEGIRKVLEDVEREAEKRFGSKRIVFLDNENNKNVYISYFTDEETFFSSKYFNLENAQENISLIQKWKPNEWDHVKSVIPKENISIQNIDNFYDYLNIQTNDDDSYLNYLHLVKFFIMYHDYFEIPPKNTDENGNDKFNITNDLNTLKKHCSAYNKSRDNSSNDYFYILTVFEMIKANVICGDDSNKDKFYDFYKQIDGYFDGDLRQKILDGKVVFPKESNDGSTVDFALALARYDSFVTALLELTYKVGELSDCNSISSICGIVHDFITQDSFDKYTEKFNESLVILKNNSKEAQEKYESIIKEKKN